LLMKQKHSRIAHMHKVERNTFVAVSLRSQ
jgi:hypothetical protein